MHEGDEDSDGAAQAAPPAEAGESGSAGAPESIVAAEASGAEPVVAADAGHDVAAGEGRHDADASADGSTPTRGEPGGDADGPANALGEPDADDLEPLAEAAPAETDERLVAILESVLFACAEPVTLGRLAEVVAGPTRGELKAALAALAERTERERRGIRLTEVAGGYQFRTAPEHAEWVRRLFQQRPWRLTRATLETLAIVAYKQPVTRAEIESIRGVDVDSVLASLLSRKLIKIVGRKDVMGRPLLYGTTRQFLEVFGLRDLAALPGLSEVAAAMPDSVGAGAVGGTDESWSADDRQDEGCAPAEAAGGLGALLPPSSGSDDPERASDRERHDGHDPGDTGASD